MIDIDILNNPVGDPPLLMNPKGTLLVANDDEDAVAANDGRETWCWFWTMFPGGGGGEVLGTFLYATST